MSGGLTLPENGFRFVLRGGEFKWVHASDLLDDDRDCTDMPDSDLEALVREVFP